MIYEVITCKGPEFVVCFCKHWDLAIAKVHFLFTVFGLPIFWKQSHNEPWKLIEVMISSFICYIVLYLLGATGTICQASVTPCCYFPPKPGKWYFRLFCHIQVMCALLTYLPSFLSYLAFHWQVTGKLIHVYCCKKAQSLPSCLAVASSTIL